MVRVAGVVGVGPEAPGLGERGALAGVGVVGLALSPGLGLAPVRVGGGQGLRGRGQVEVGARRLAELVGQDLLVGPHHVVEPVVRGRLGPLGDVLGQATDGAGGAVGLGLELAVDRLDHLGVGREGAPGPHLPADGGRRARGVAAGRGQRPGRGPELAGDDDALGDVFEVAERPDVLPRVQVGVDEEGRGRGDVVQGVAEPAGPLELRRGQARDDVAVEHVAVRDEVAVGREVAGEEPAADVGRGVGVEDDPGPPPRPDVGGGDRREGAAEAVPADEDRRALGPKAGEEGVYLLADRDEPLVEAPVDLARPGPVVRDAGEVRVADPVDDAGRERGLGAAEAEHDVGARGDAVRLRVAGAGEERGGLGVEHARELDALEDGLGVWGERPRDALARRRPQGERADHVGDGGGRGLFLDPPAPGERLPPAAPVGQVGEQAQVVGVDDVVPVHVDEHRRPPLRDDADAVGLP